MSFFILDMDKNKNYNYTKKLIFYYFLLLQEKMKTIVGLTKKNIIKLSALRNEPEFILKFRLNSYNKFKKMSFPKWMNINLDLNNLNLNKLSIYSEINEENKWKTLKKIDQKIKKH